MLLSGSKKAVQPAPSSRLTAPVLIHPEIFSATIFLYRHIVQGKALVDVQGTTSTTVGYRYGTMRWDPPPPMSRVSGSAGGQKKRMLSWQPDRDHRTPDLWSVGSSYTGHSDQTVTGKGKETRGRGDRHSWMPTARLTGRSQAISWSEQRDVKQDRERQE